MQGYNSMIMPPSNFGRAKLFTPVVTGYLIVSLLLSLLPNAISFTLSANRFMHGQLWTLLTFTFVNDGIVQFVFNAVVVVLLGSFIEKQWKSLPFLLFLGIVSVLSGILWIVITPLAGASEMVAAGSNCLCFAMMIVFGILRRNSYMPFPTGNISILNAMILFLVISALLNLRQPTNLIMLSGALWGLLYMVGLKKLSSKKADTSNYSNKPERKGFVDLD